MAKRRFAAKTATMLSVTLLTIASGTLSTSAFAADEDPGWYFGLNGGYGKLSDTDNQTAGGQGTDGETALQLLGTLDIPELGGLCGLLGPIILPLPDALANCVFTPGTPGAGAASFSSTYEDGETYGLNFGYGYSNGFRPEFGVAYRSNDWKQVSNSSIGSLDAEGQLTSLSASANLWYDFFSSKDSVRPYIGFGVGASQVEAKDFSVTSTAGTTTIDDKKTVMSYQAGLGVNFRMGDSSQLSLGYRYLSASGVKFDVGNGAATVESDYKHSAVMLGLNMYLKDNALVGDEDGDGVPDNKDKCPGTPLGVIVNADGCPADADGDGVADNLDKCPGTPTGVTVGSDGCPIDSDGDGVPDYLDKCPDTKPGQKVGPNGCALDADGDGVPDALDRCPNSPPGVAVGPDGCPLDSDNDGVPDNLDKCPGTPAGAIVDANGCEPDGDGDGVPDRLDRCPDTPPGEKVGPNGCPNDSDGDGVPDDQDECPNTPAGAKVLANGCALKGDCRTPRPGEEVDQNGCAIDQVFILRGVNFEFDSDRLTPEAKEILKQVAQTLQAYPDVNVEIAGHTDSIGTDAYNLGLSEKRSIAVKSFLSGQGVNAGRMTPNGYGESQPIDSNETEEGRAKNRRVELRVIEENNAAVRQ